MSLDALSRQLWKQRETLEVMLFKLEEERLITSTASSRWLPRATRELEAVIAQAQTMELERSMESEAVAIDLGLPPEASLKEIAEAADEPWQTLLNQHREALISLTSEIADMSKANQEVLSSLQRATQETLMSMQGAEETYGEDGGIHASGTGESTMLDTSM